MLIFVYMQQVEIKNGELEKDLKAKTSNTLSEKEDEIREFIERKLIEEDTLNVRDQLIDGVDPSDQNLRQNLDKKVTNIIHNMYDSVRDVTNTRKLVNTISSSIQGISKDTKEGGKIIISSWSDLIDNIEDLRFSNSRIKRILSDMVLGGVGGLAVGGLAATIGLMAVYPAQAATTLGGLICVSILGSIGVAKVQKFKQNIDTVLPSVNVV